MAQATDEELVDDAVEAEGGRFTAAGRRAAINASLPLLATYFADAPTWELEVSQQLATTPDEKAVDDLAKAVRLRASLAAAERLLRILGDIAARPTFRYSQVSAESVGQIRGRLDLSRYSREHGRIAVPRRYPIRLVERENATPENILASYAAHWIRRDLTTMPRDFLPARSPELRDLQRLQDGLGRSLGLPLLAGTSTLALDVWRRSALPDLIERVNARLEAGHIASPEPYKELADWVAATRYGTAVADVGDREWSFYDSRFDTKLFEIWCLLKLANAITALIGPPATAAKSLAQRNRGPMYTWNIGAGSLQLHFQASLTALAEGGVVWSFEPGPGQLLGFPDLAVTADTVAGRGLAIFDPKLRRRPGKVPTEELYKLLGYFGNLKHSKPPMGAIFYYSPGELTDHTLISDQGGELHALGLDPEVDSMTPFEAAARLAVKAAGLGERSLSLLGAPRPEDSSDAGEFTAAIHQEVAVDAMRREADRLPPSTLGPTLKATETSLRAIWPQLDEQAQTMIVTAEYFGLNAPRNADHSGPLLGLAAAFERVLNERIFHPAAEKYGALINLTQTLGGRLHTLDAALRGRSEPEAKAIAAFLKSQQNIDSPNLQAILRDSKNMNRLYRIPAAHSDIVAFKTWADGRDIILDPREGLLVRLMKSFAADVTTATAD
ncbi:hypothetical protein Asphe3_41530 (plasmid) [Pseudarthrobacter phenanthrenivorans Sphe3]|uniref:Uncharacterized protein n=1 Tax=Pseudarthrobacter phenanthrenivorans (strain DSM 18606 / JCM 16027 / LMG 23796 / Sphe3) TaxID=930171 RepID=F0MCG7_PSEPM|nr:hypothetical protein [Pseudarthrobacter phenanthrenivorans]ADX75218.1 hypothetical protein Asphe3_41530 [Pseudarthrobacter phenanthrenivorans Sphe3]